VGGALAELGDGVAQRREFGDLLVEAAEAGLERLLDVVAGGGAGVA
jgi:hypothetical protein